MHSSRFLALAPMNNTVVETMMNNIVCLTMLFMHDTAELLQHWSMLNNVVETMMNNIVCLTMLFMHDTAELLQHWSMLNNVETTRKQHW